MEYAARLHGLPRPALILAVILGFWWFWPVGLATLAYLVGSGRLGNCWRERRSFGRWYNAPPDGQQQQQQRGCGWGVWGNSAQSRPAPSGNRAFDEYRAATLTRLEEEQKEFVEYLDRLRQAKDKAEFDQFMADRRRPTIMPEQGNPT